ncbi:hypothetical protein MMC19_004653 [Ptychographa xylographoides]|nr:hypothetical protein [Ptychographa xylographoides]
MSKIPTEWRLSNSDLEQAKQRRKLTGAFIESFLDEEELEIVRTDSVPLVERLAYGRYNAKQVVRAFCKTAAMAHQINNCLHEILFDQALQRANELDEYYNTNGKPVGPLHGLPISLKDQFYVRGIDTSMGYVGWIGTYEGDDDPKKVHKFESQIVKELLSLGGVMYCKTSLPQTLVFGETVNNIIGRTLNPVNQILSCGGSSGGEGALQALRGSTLGVGTDIAGLSAPNTMQNPGQNTYRSAVGYLATSIDALKLIMTSVLSTKPWLRDPEVVTIPWRQEIADNTLARARTNGAANDKLPLKLGVFWTDNVVAPQPPITRGLHTVVDTLRAAGHIVVDWNPPSQDTAKRVHLAFLKADGAHHIHQQLDVSGEPLIPQLRASFQLRDPIPLLEYQDLTLQGLDYEASYSDYWNTTKEQDGQVVDAVIMPVAPHAAVIPGKYYHTAYTECINLMNYSACVIPVTTASKDIDAFDESYEPLNDVNRKNWEAYDPEIYDGAPVGIQLVARKYEEEKIWAVAKIVNAALKTAGVN